MRNRLVVSFLLIVALVFVGGNIITQKGGVLDKAILNKNDPYYKMDQHVKGRSVEGFAPTEFVPFVLKFPTGINSKADLKKALEFNDKLEAEFGDRILSLAQIPHYQDTGTELLDEPYLNPEVTDIDQWKKRIEDSPYYGVFVGRDFDYLIFSLFLEPDYDEIQEFRRIVGFLEERKIPWYEWWYKTDIFPKNPNLGIAGWVMGRGLIDLALSVDILTLVTLGLLFTFPIFVLSLRSVTQSLIATLGVVLMSLLWTRGSIGIMQLFGLDIKERVYLLLAYANCIVQGVSFSLHKFESLNQKTRVNWLIAITALIAIGSFATLYWFQVLTIRELGVISAIGVSFLFILAVVFLPALNAIFRVRSKPAKQSSKIIRWFEFVISKLVNGCSFLAVKVSFTGALAIVAVLAMLAAGLIINGQLIIRTRPLEFIQNTLVHKTGKYLNKKGRIGFDFVDLLVESQVGIYDPDFIRRAWSFQKKLKSLPATREVTSVLNSISEISQESYKKPLPTEKEELFESFFLLENSQIASLQEQFWYDKGIRLSVSTRADDSNALGEFISAILELAQSRYPDLKVSAFGKLSSYPRVDRYIRLGKPWNMFNSQWVVIVFCGLLIFLINRRLKSYLQLSPIWGGIIMSVPFVFASAVMALVMIIFEIPLDIATAAITALAINASIDFSIYFVAAYQEGLDKTKNRIKAIAYAMQDKGKIIIEDMILNAICFAPLLSSHFIPVHRLGWIMAVMLLACGFGALVIMPALLPKAVKGGVQDEKIFGRADLAPAD